MSRNFAISFLCLLLCEAALASSPDAWAEHYREVTRHCLNDSGLRNARPEGDLLPFSDKVGTALLVRGFKADSRKSTLVLCIHQRGGDKVECEPVYDGIEIDSSMLPVRSPSD